MEFTDLEIWKESRKLVSMIYLLTKSFSKDEQFGLTSQIRRSAISIPSNVAEGCGRRISKDTLQFLHIARGSIYELETQLYLAIDLNYIIKEKQVKINNHIVICKKLLNGFINYYKKLQI